MAEEEKDAAYSDKEFGSEHEYEVSDNEFDDEDTEVNTIPVGVKMDSQVGDCEEDAAYDGEFDEDDTTIVVNPPSLTINDSRPSNAEMTVNGSQEDTALYDGEFDEDDEVDAVSPGFESNETTVEQALGMTPPDGGNESPESPNDRIDESDDNDIEYSNDLEHDTPAATPENTSLLRNPCEETVTERRSSVPAQLSDDFQSNARIVRADSTPMVLPATLIEKWMDTVPQELSPERHDQPRKSSACFPVQEDLLQLNLVDDENDTDKSDNAAAVNSVPNIVTSRARAQSYQDLFQKEIVVPIRRAQSLLYARSLPSVEEIDVAEETDPEHNQEGDNAYSDDEGSYGEDSHASFESEHDNDEVKPTIRTAAHNIALEGHPATNITGDLDSNSPMLAPFTNTTTPGEQILPNKGNTSESKSLLNGEDDYADEMEDTFPSDSKIPQFEEDDTPDKSDDEAGDVTETLPEESRTLLGLQQNESKINEQTHDEQSGIPPDTSTPLDIQEQKDTNLQNMKESEAEKFTSPYEFADTDADASNQETLQQIITEDYGGFGQYELDTDEFENHELTASLLPQEEPREIDVEQAKDSFVPQTVAVTEDTQPTGETMCIENGEVTTAHAIEQKDQKNAPVRSKGPPKQNRPDKEQVASQPVRPKWPVQKSSPLKQSPQATKPSRPPTKRTTPAPSLTPSSSSVDVQQSATAPRPYRKTVTPDSQTTNPNPIGSSGETTKPNPSPTKQSNPPKTTQKVLSPRIPSNACSDPYQYLPNDPQLPRKEPVPRQKVSSNPSTKGEHRGKRRQLQPVRTPANLRFSLPKMDKTKRDWLFANMFRHGDDMSKYEAFVPSTFLAKPPTSHSQETKKRPLSAHHIYGAPHTTRFVSPSRKLVPQSNPANQDRERSWVATTPHDSKLPSYDSILDKYCTAVTNPMVQRQIYQTRDRDLSPQLAFVLEKRVEKSCRKGFYDSFGGVNSYKTEIVPTSPSDGTRQRQISPHHHTKSGMLERHAIASQELQ